MRRFLAFLYDAAGYLAAFFVFGIFAAMIAQTAMREMGFSTKGMDDLVAWMAAGAFFLALAHTFRHGDFVRVSLLLEHLGVRTRTALEAAGLAIAAVFTGYLAWWAVRYVYESWKFKEISTGQVIVPIWIPQLTFSIGACLLFVAVLEQLWEVLRGRKPLYQIATDERHARGDYSEDY